MSRGAPTASSLMKQNPPVPYSNLLRKVTNHVKKLQDDLAHESTTNIEFEESSKRSFEFLTDQVKSLKNAFNTLADTLLDELENMATQMQQGISGVEKKTVQSHAELTDVYLALQKDIAMSADEDRIKLSKLSDSQKELERKIELLGQDMDAILATVPKIEDNSLKSANALENEISNVLLEVNKVNDVIYMERVKTDSKFERADIQNRELRQEMEDRILRSHASLQQQMGHLSRLVVQGPTAFGQTNNPE